MTMAIAKMFPLISKLFIYLCLVVPIVVYGEEPSNDVKVTPDIYVDDGNPYMEFTCEAQLAKGDKLSWIMLENEEVTEEPTTEASTSTSAVTEKKDSTSKTKATEKPTTKASTSISAVTEKKDSTSKTKATEKPTSPTTKAPTSTSAVTEKKDSTSKTTATEKPTTKASTSTSAVTEKKDSTSKTKKTLLLYEERDAAGLKQLDLQHPLIKQDNDTEIYCAKETTVAGKPVTLKSKNIHIIFKNDNGANSTEVVWIWPSLQTIVYNDTTPLKLTCWAYLEWQDLTPQINGDISVKKFDELYPNPDPKHSRAVSWYQQFGESIPARFAMLPQTNERGYVKLDVSKTFRRVDNGTKIFCATESMALNLSTDIQNQSHTMLLLFHETPHVLCHPSDLCNIVFKLGWVVAKVLLVLTALAVIGLTFMFAIFCFYNKFCESSKKSKLN